MKNFWNIFWIIIILVKLISGLYLGVTEGNWESLIRFGIIIGIIFSILVIYEIIKNKMVKNRDQKNDEFLKLDDLILDKDVNKAIEENALTSVKEQKSENNPEIK